MYFVTGETNNKLTSQCLDKESSVARKHLSEETNSWQQNLLKLTTNTDKPLVFHRNDVLSTKPENLKDSSPEFQQPDCIVSDSGHKLDTHQSECCIDNNSPANYHYSNYNEKPNADNILLVDLGVEPTSLRKIEDAKMLDLQKIILSDYPIINNIKADDLILYKVRIPYSFI